ncbi:MAG TPA: hypothetical protein ENI74_09150 [Gammaproteobacteria bacterium]|nr:hypothetical protein [Gammaproteobacteria bacterium]
MKSYMRSTIWCLVAALGVISSSVRAADISSSTLKTGAEDSTSPLAGFLTLELIMLVGVVLLALAVVARTRTAHTEA